MMISQVADWFADSDKYSADIFLPESKAMLIKADQLKKH
jgi:chorismate mutase / prephenate dehydrogenase